MFCMYSKIRTGTWSRGMQQKSHSITCSHVFSKVLFGCSAEDKRNIEVEHGVKTKRAPTPSRRWSPIERIREPVPGHNVLFYRLVTAGVGTGESPSISYQNPNCFQVVFERKRPCNSSVRRYVSQQQGSFSS